MQQHKELINKEEQRLILRERKARKAKQEEVKRREVRKAKG